MNNLWELACLRCRRRGLAGTAQRCHRGQARSHKGSWQAADSAGNASPVGAGLPAMQTARSGRHCAAMQSRASPLPQRGLARRGFCWRCITCGSWLACDPGYAVRLMHRRDAIAGKPAPTKGPARRGFCWRWITCGSWLACDTGDAVWPVHRSAAIAGKPAPTKGSDKPIAQMHGRDSRHNLFRRCCRRKWHGRAGRSASRFACAPPGRGWR